MEHNNLPSNTQSNLSYNASFAPNTSPNIGQQQEAQAQTRPLPPLESAPDLSAPVSPRGLQNYRTSRPLEEEPDTFNLPEYQPIKPGEPHMQKLADEAANTRKIERSLKHAQECEADGDFQDAEKAYKQALKFTENAEHYKLYAACLKEIYLTLSQASSKDEAKEVIYREKSAKAFYYLGDLYQKQGTWKPAQTAYKTSCELACHEVPLQALVAASRQLGEKGDIVEALEKLADFYAGKGKIDLAIEKLEEALQVEQSFTILQKLEVLCGQAGGDGSQLKVNETRIQQFELQISEDSKSISVHRKYIWFLKSIGMQDEARAVKERMDAVLQQNLHNTEHLGQKLVKQKGKIRGLKQTIQSQDGKLESLEKQIEFLGKQVTHLDCSHWPDMRDADLIPLLKKNPSLQCLSLDGCIYLTDVVLDILPTYFENLQELNLRGCKGVTQVGLDAIAENATKLKRLTLDHCPATTITLLHKLNTKGIIFSIEGVVFKKKVLNLRPHKDDLTDAELLKALEANPEITELCLADCTKITDAGLAPLKNFQWLTVLNLCNCKQLTNAALQHFSGLAQLTYLNLNWCYQITDVGLEYLAGLTQLTYLGSHDFNQVTDAGLKYFVGLTQLTILELYNYPKITDEGLRKLDLTRLTQISALSLYNCKQITDAGFRELLVLSQLKSLYVNGTYITDTGLMYLSGLSQLTSLCLLGCTKFTDAGLQHLAGLTQLKSLDLRGCTQLSSNAKEELKKQIPGLEIKE